MERKCRLWHRSRTHIFSGWRKMFLWTVLQAQQGQWIMKPVSCQTHLNNTWHTVHRERHPRHYGGQLAFSDPHQQREAVTACDRATGPPDEDRGRDGWREGWVKGEMGEGRDGWREGKTRVAWWRKRWIKIIQAFINTTRRQDLYRTIVFIIENSLAMQ